MSNLSSVGTPRTWRVLLLDTKKSNPNHYICLAIARALGQSDRIERVVRSEYRTAVHDALHHKCDLLIAFDGEQLDRVFVEKIVSVCNRSVLWVTEDPYERTINAGNADLFDLVFTNDAGSVDTYGAKGRHLPFAADTIFHQHSIPAFDAGHYLYDLFFAGTAWPNRSNFINKLQRAIPDINLKLALPTNPHIPAPNLAIDRSAYDWRTPNTEFAKFANRSRTVLTLHREFSSSGNDPVSKTPGPRFFEVALAGGFQLVDTSIPEIEVDHFYQEGRDYVSFKNVAECTEKLEFYLRNGDARLSIARSAQQVTRDLHLYLNRVESLLDSIDEADQQDSQTPPEIKLPPHTRRRVLIVSHNILGVKPYGGVEVYQETIRTSLGTKYEFLFYTPERGASANSKYILRDENLHALEEFNFSSAVDEKVLSCPEREAAFSRIMRDYAVDVVHFQHLIGHVPSLALLPRSLGLGTVLSLHDYYGICSRFNLLDYKGSYCHINKRTIETCDVCLNAAESVTPGSQAKRRAFFSRLLQSIDILHANTDGVAEMYRDIYPSLQISNNIRVGGVPMPPPNPPIQAHRRDLKKQNITVAIPGNIAPNKGGDAIIHAMNLLRDEDIEFTIFGTLAPHYVEILSALDLKNLRVHGEFSPGQLPHLLRDSTISLHLSNWPETYCISLSEAWAAGVVPIVSDIGALGERVEHGINGFKIPPNEPGSLVALLRRIVADRTLIDALTPALKESSGVTQDDHMVWLASVYDELIPTQITQRSESSQPGSTLHGLGFLLMEPRWSGPALAHPPLVIPVLGAFPLPAQTITSRLRRLHQYIKIFGIIRTIFKIVEKAKKRLRAGR